VFSPKFRREKEMIKNLGNPVKTRERTPYAIALILLLSLSTIMAIVPAVNAHVPGWEIPTVAFLNVEPNPVGINQPVQVTMWLDKVPPTAAQQFGDRWENLTVTVTKPDGTTEQLGPFTTSDVGATDTRYIPSTIGTYYFQMYFPGQVLEGKNPPPRGNTNAFINDTYMASTSPKVALVVQQQQIEYIPNNPLPTGYWQRPINGFNSNWASIAGDWLLSGYDGAGNRWNPFTTAPNSAHILWTKPLAFGGVNGGNFTDWNYYTGLAYETKFNGPIIMYGRLYMNLPHSTSAGAGGAACFDLRTGEQIWWLNNTRLSFGQEYDYSSPNQFGAIPYLWSSGGGAYNIYDPFDGSWLYRIENVTSGTTTFGPNGEILTYTLNAARGWVAMWNSSRAIMAYQYTLPGGNAWQWRPMMQTVMDWNLGVQWNATIQPLPAGVSSIAIQKVSSGVILAASGSIATPQNWQWEAGFSIEDGHQLWSQNRSTPIGQTTWALMGPASDGVYTEFHESEMSWYGFSLNTGEQLWGPTEPYPKAFGMYSWQASIAYGMLLGLDFGGYVHAFNVQTGEKVWDFYAGSSGLETAYGSWPLNNPAPTSADGKIYVVDGHAYNPPIYKGAHIYCINATNGELIWKSLGYYTYDPIEIADGILVAYSVYDAQIHAYGQGRSATTVNAPDVAIPLGSQVLIQGTVTDQSPGQTCLGVPAAGTPAISDESMSDWMAYLYSQQPKPTNATGVTVTLTAIDPNGNWQLIGTPTSDDKGNFATAWTPPVPGLYTVTAKFEGSNSYYASEAGTSFIVSSAPSAKPASTENPAVSPTASVQPSSTIPVQSVSPSLTQAPQPTSNMPTTTYIVICIAVIVVVAAAAALVLRRRNK
jgi:outer membrane protein assembly factor BamB